MQCIHLTTLPLCENVGGRILISCRHTTECSHFFRFIILHGTPFCVHPSFSRGNFKHCHDPLPFLWSADIWLLCNRIVWSFSLSLTSGAVRWHIKSTTLAGDTCDVRTWRMQNRSCTYRTTISISFRLKLITLINHSAHSVCQLAICVCSFLRRKCPNDYSIKKIIIIMCRHH